MPLVSDELDWDGAEQREIEVDGEPLQMVADAFLLSRRIGVAAIGQAEP